MRIVCPRCVAQYEVDESSIPQTGREVQCANCENIWFQDYIEMLPTSVDEDVDAIQDEDRGVFDDLDGKSDTNFYSNRGAGPDDDDFESFDDDADDTDAPTDLTSYEPDDFDEDDDAPATNIPVPPVDPDVLDVLRSEAAFSSARDQIDAATADALDDADQPTDPADVDVDELSAFLDAHSAGDAPEPDDITESIAEDIAEDSVESAADTDSDPLADLDAIRSQLNNIGDTEPEIAPEYTPNLPADDPIESAPDVLDDDVGTAFEEPNDVVDAKEEEPVETAFVADEPEYDDDFDTAALTAALDIGGQDRPELDDDFDDEDDGPRHAYRADGITPPDGSELEEEPEDEIDNDLSAALKTAAEPAKDEDVQDLDGVEDDAQDDDTTPPIAAVAATAAAAIGMTRPRSKGGRARARALPGTDVAPEKIETPSEELSATIADAVQDAPKEIEPDITPEDLEAAVDTSRQAAPSRRPKTERKAMLPDVEELDASLRSDGEEPRRRDREMMDAHEDELANTGKGGFRRAFIWTLFIIILLIALYVLRPQLVAMLPAAAIVLDPYAGAIDAVRGLINGILG
jgi:predicted Zn finger-like uncharacterized protein